MDSAIRWLRASYIAGAVADGLIGILMLIPGRMGETEFRYPMGLGAVLMFGWAALLLWGNIKPLERKGILLLTIFPVITGMVVTGIWAAASGFFPVKKIIPSSVLGLALAFLFSFSYLKARSAEKK
ncbi:MAG: hypothetical protein GTO17_04535 [Candidatus Aminicenantes bacterium]|nr:hypothetical protein [Candidatus Aminicenantes bacterium]